jgi:hypothetical protein
MKKVALIHLAQNTTVTRMKHHKPVEKVIATAACGAGTHVKRRTDETVVTCHASRRAWAEAQARREVQAAPVHTDHIPDPRAAPPIPVPVVESSMARRSRSSAIVAGRPARRPRRLPRPVAWRPALLLADVMQNPVQCA